MSAARWRSPTVPIREGVERFDGAVDDWFETHMRGRPAGDRLMYTASALGDHALIWLGLAAVQALRRRGDWQRPLLRAAAALGLESVIVNGPVKWIFRRRRPVHPGVRPLQLRMPRTSSFPSGHATSAFLGAALLRDDDALWPLYYAIAVIVAASRVHVKIHHASDVIGGIALGVVLGELARGLGPRRRLSPIGAEQLPAGSGVHAAAESSTPLAWLTTS